MPGVLTQLNRAFFRERYFQRCRAWDSLNPPRLGVRAPGLDDYGKEKARLYAIEDEIMTWDTAGRRPTASWCGWLKHPIVGKIFRPVAAPMWGTNDLEYVLKIIAYVARGRPQSMLSGIRKTFFLRGSKWEVNAGSLRQAAELLIVHYPNPVPSTVLDTLPGPVKIMIGRGLQQTLEYEIYREALNNLAPVARSVLEDPTFHAWIDQRRIARRLHA